MIDFTSCHINKFKAYGGGNGNKIGIVYQGENYMLKFPAKKQETKILYPNACISEYLSCNIYQSVGIDAQKTLYGKYLNNGKYKEVVACKDFAVDGYYLMEFYKLKNACLSNSSENSNGQETELETILDSIEDQKLINPNEFKTHFWNMFIMDAFLGNFDRHNGNWGLLINEEKQLAKISPVYDCGSCLYPRLTDGEMNKVLNDIDEINQRIFVFPKSAIKVNNQKIDYVSYISSNNNQDCTKSLFEIVPNIDINKICSIIEQEEFLSPIKKEFYKTMLKLRKELILDFSINKIRFDSKIKYLNSFMVDKDNINLKSFPKNPIEVAYIIQAVKCLKVNNGIWENNMDIKIASILIENYSQETIENVISKLSPTAGEMYEISQNKNKNFSR